MRHFEKVVSNFGRLQKGRVGGVRQRTPEKGGRENIVGGDEYE